MAGKYKLGWACKNCGRERRGKQRDRVPLQLEAEVLLCQVHRGSAEDSGATMAGPEEDRLRFSLALMG